jgi:uroporphyrinogen decarboxylase
LIDVHFAADDLAGQHGPLIAPALWRKIIKPRQARIIATIKAYTSAKVFYHTCGAATEFLDDLIEIGVDILNPVQVSAAGMETNALKKRYGDRLSFWGGGCDTQTILPFGTPAEVRAEVKRRLKDLSPGGGFVFNPVHNIQANVPPENIVAMFEEAYGYAGN